MFFSLLGPLRVTDGAGAEVELRGTVRRTLLAALLLRANNVVPIDRLAELLWETPGTFDSTTARRIYNQITRLRQTLDEGHGVGAERVRAVPPGYLIRTAPGELDLDVFAKHLASGRQAGTRGDWGTARDEYAASLACMRRAR